MVDDTKQTHEVNVLRNVQPTAKRTAKNSVFLDLFQNKSYLLKLYKTLHLEAENPIQYRCPKNFLTVRILILR